MSNKHNNAKHTCKFCGDTILVNNMQGYCQKCYKYFIMDNKKIYNIPEYGHIAVTENGDIVCPLCGKAFRKLGQHLYLSHKLLAQDAFVQFGWPKNVKASNAEYRYHMKDVQHKKCVDINLIERGKNTRYINKDERITGVKSKRPKKKLIIEESI